MEGGAAAAEANDVAEKEASVDARRFSLRKLLFKTPKVAPSEANASEGSPPLAVWRNPAAKGSTEDASSLRAEVPSLSALNPARLKELHGVRLTGDSLRPPPYCLPGRGGGSPLEGAANSMLQSSLRTPGKSRRSDPTQSKPAARHLEDLVLHDELSPGHHRSISKELGSSYGSPNSVGRSGHSRSHSRGGRSRHSGGDGNSPRPAVLEAHDPELGPPPMPGASPGMLAAQYEAWQRARTARAVPPVSLSGSSSAPSTRGSSQQGGTPVSLGSTSAQSSQLVCDSPTKAAGPSQRPPVLLPEPGAASEQQTGDIVNTSPVAGSRAILRAAAAAAGSKYGL